MADNILNPYSNLCAVCESEVSTPERRGVMTLHYPEDEREQRERLIARLNAEGTPFTICSRDGVNPVLTKE